jgi:hypothetical protein
MSEFRVKPGLYFGYANQYGPGAVVILTDEEAAGFLDKLELVTAPVEEPSAPTGWGDLDAKIVASLEAAGLTPAAVPTMADDALLAITGIGPATLLKIRSAL